MELESLSFAVDDDGVAHIHLAGGDRGNPVDLNLTQELGWVASECADRGDVRAVLLTADGRFFSVGGDLRSMAKDPDGTTSFISQATVGFHAATARFARMDAPVVVAVHGLAAGGGVSIVAAADFALAGRSASFYAAYPAIGMAVDGGFSYFVPRRVGTRRATEFLLRNETWDAETAAANGLITEVVEDDALRDAAWALARQLASGPTVSFGEMKRLFLSGAEESLETQLELEARSMVKVTRTQDTRNAIQAVAAKQKPTFEGR